MLEQYFIEDFIFLDWEVKDRNELFKKLDSILQKKGYVKEGFYNFLCHREDDYPTGLELETHTVAIPHGDPEYIKDSFISVVRLKQAISMRKMENPDEEILVNLFFVLGLKEGGEHLNVLKKLIKAIQKQDFIDEINNAVSTKQIIELIKNQEN